MDDPHPPVPVPYQLLCFDAATKGSRPELWTVSPSDLINAILDLGCKGVLVASYSGLERILETLGSELRFIGDQHVTRSGGKVKTTCLAQTFYPHREVTLVGVRSAYTSAGRAEQGVRSYVPHVPKGRVRIVAVEDRIYRTIRHRAVPPAPDRDILRAIRGVLTGASRAVEKLCNEIAALAPGAGSVMILGETGTGKDLAATLLHRFSGRKGELQIIHAAAIPESIAEGELFGTVVGAGTGSINRAGPFEVASGGTVFIDEIGEMSLQNQARLLRVIQNRKVIRVGSTKPIPVDFKLIVATHRDLAAMVRRGQFREDLFQRIRVSVIAMPVAREHREDIEFHVQRAWRQHTGGESFPKHLTRLLAKHDWPGNTRQIQNFMEALHTKTRREPLSRRLVDAELRAVFPSKPDPEPPAPPRRRPAPPGPDDALGQAVRSYEVARAAYSDLEQVARSLVERLVADLAPLALVRSRTKTPTALAERMQRDWTDHVFRDVRDLCGVRVIVQAEEHKLALLDALERFVEVERGPYPPGHDPARDAERAPALCWIRIHRSQVKDVEGRLGMGVPTECAGHWCELQLRTTTEDAIATWRETITGRLDAPPPESWTTALGEVEAALTRAQELFERIRRCATTYGGHLSRADMRRELLMIERTLRCAPSDPTTAARGGKLALYLGEFDRARSIMAPYEASQYGPLLRDLGVVTCQTRDPVSDEYARGVDLLERACKASPRDPEALAALAGVYLRMDQPERALECHRAALRIDDSYPYAVSGLLQLELRSAPTADLVAVHRAMLKRAVLRCREEIQASVGIPFARLNLAKFLMLLGKTREGLAEYVEAMRAATAPFMFQTSIDSLASLLEAACVPAELDLARRMLQVGLCARYPTSGVASECSAALTRLGYELQGPVVMLVGRGHDPSASALTAMGGVLADALAEFRGTVVSVGDLDRATSAVRGALALLPDGARSAPYRKAEIARLCSLVPDPQVEDVFYPTLAVWADVVTAGVLPSSVLLLALGDESRTAPDRALARALGAHVAVLEVDHGSGESSSGADRVIGDAIALRVILERLRGH